MARPKSLVPAFAAMAVVAALTTAATTVKSSKSNSSDRAGTVSGKVTAVDEGNKTFTLTVVMSGANLSRLPAVGDVVDVAFTSTPDGPMMAANLNFSKSNVN